MSFRRKNFYIASFILCGTLAIAVQLTRAETTGINSLLDTFLGSSPSFLYLFGIMSVIPIVQPKVNIQTFKKYILWSTAGALTYEMEQYWTSMIFDLNDIVATLFAAVLMFVLHSNYRKAI